MKVTRVRLAALLLLFAGAWSALGIAHESQPGLLEIRQLTTERWEIIWRAPIYYGKPHPARLALPSDWQSVGDRTIQYLTDSYLHRLVVAFPPDTLDGSTIGFPGLEQTITDVFVRLSRLDGSQTSQAVHPATPSVVLRGERPWFATAGEYIRLGFNHILLGIDHLLFMLGLLIIVRGRRRLVETITAFTLAHSVTLALATLGYTEVPGPPLNAAIALSILFLALEIVRARRGATSFTIRHPWLVALCFGLLHGFGFASGLSTIGMPQPEVPLALAMFNVGVELGHLFFVALALLSYWSLQTLQFRWPHWADLAPAYIIGSLGTYWTIQRTLIMF